MQHVIEKNLKTNFICHPQAVTAFELTQAIFSSHTESDLSKHKILHLTRICCFKYFERADGKKVFFSGWLPQILKLDNYKKTDVYNVHSNIEFQAWLYALESILILSCRKTLISNLVLFFNCVPENIKFRFFNGRVPSTLQAQLVEFTGESKASIRHYLQKSGV